MYTKMNILCTKWRKMSPKGKKASYNFRSGGRYLDSCCNVLISLKVILNHYWNNYFNSSRYFNRGCDVKLSLNVILNHYWNNYFNSVHYFDWGCDVKLSMKFILNHYWNNYFNSGRYFNSGCNNAWGLIEEFPIDCDRLEYRRLNSLSSL